MGDREIFDLAVIGAGSAGFSAGITAAEFGARVALVGHGTIGDGTVNLFGARVRGRLGGVSCGLNHGGNAADFGPDPECLRPGGSVLGGSGVIAAEVEEIVDLIVG